MDDQTVLGTLEDLLECRNGEEGFLTSADAISNAQYVHGSPPSIDGEAVSSLFRELAAERASFADELRQLVAVEGGEPDEAEGGSLLGALHRGWINLKAAVTAGDPGAVIRAAEEGEDHAVAAYRQALEGDLPEETRMVIERQYRSVQAAHDRVRALEEAFD